MPSAMALGERWVNPVAQHACQEGCCSLRFCCSQESSSSTRVAHPCYPKDYSETISLSSFRTSPCTNQSDPRLTLVDRNVTLEGRGNASGCLAAIKKLFNFSACGQRQDCTFDGIYQPPVSGQFIVRQIPASHPCGRAWPRCCGVPVCPMALSPPSSRRGQEAPKFPFPQGTTGTVAIWFSNQLSKWDHVCRTSAWSKTKFSVKKIKAQPSASRQGSACARSAAIASTHLHPQPVISTGDMDSDALGLRSSGTNPVKDKARLLLRGRRGQLPVTQCHFCLLPFRPSPPFTITSSFST